MILASTGSLISGTYQFCYRLIRQIEYVDGENKIYDYKESKFSLPTAPIFISDKIDNLAVGDGQIGGSSDTRIRLSIYVTDDETLYYTHYQVCVLRRLDGQYLPPSEAYLFEPISFSGIAFPDTFEMSSNYEYRQIPVSSVTIDFAPIESFKTIEQKNNIGFLGNIKYFDRDINTSFSFNKSNTETIVKDIGVSHDPSQPSGSQGYSDPITSHKYVGHFRDEVYRYAAGYIDEFGNPSSPKIFNFNGAVNNFISDAGAIDWRFPSRDDDGYTLFNDSGGIQALGLRIAEIDNHPTWAKGIYILRAKRRENIKFQTPIIPLCIVQPAIANTETAEYQKYPVTDGDTLPDPNGTLIPKDFIRKNVAQSSVRDSSGAAGVWTDHQKGDPETFVHMIFPVQAMYQNGVDIIENIQENSTKSLKIVDAAGLKFHTSSFTETPSGLSNPGKYRNETSTLYASTYDQYYYEDNQPSKTKITTISGFDHGDIRILEYGIVENFGGKYVIKSSVEDLETPSVFGYSEIAVPESVATAPDVLRAGVIVTNKSLRDPSFETLNSNGAIKYDLNGTPTGIINTVGGTADVHIVSSVLIANALTGLSDTRYGNETDYNEFIPVQFEITGSGISSTRYMFNETELSKISAGQSNPISVDVWGGDCFISRHNFKISNGTFRLTGNDGISYSTSTLQALSEDIADHWGDEYGVTNSAGTNAYSMPVGVEGYSQIIQLYLESKVNSDLIQRDTCQTAGENFSLIENSVFEIRVPFNYNYMLAYSLENALKIFVSEDILDRDSNIFPSRIVYTNTHVDGTTIEGFDEFPVANTYDLEGKYGGITKLINFSNKMYCVQEKSLSYIPVQANIIQTATDTNQLSIRSAEVIGQHQNVTTNVGSRHIRSVVVSDTDLYFTDINSKKIIKFSDKSSLLSEKGIGSDLDAKFSLDIAEKDLHAFYDFVNYKYIITKSYNGDGWSYVWNEKFNSWESELDISSGMNILELFYLYPSVYAIGINSSGNLSIEKLYDSNSSVWFGTQVVPRIKYTSVPNGTPVVFDNISVDSDNRLDSIKATVVRDSILGNYYTEHMDLEKDQRDGLYKIKVLRNINPLAVDYTSATSNVTVGDTAVRTGQRMRGTYMESEVLWIGDSVVTLSTVLSKFRQGRKPI